MRERNAMKISHLHVVIKTDQDWSDERLMAVCEQLDSALDNLPDIIRQMLSKIPESEHLIVEVS